MKPNRATFRNVALVAFSVFASACAKNTPMEWFSLSRVLTIESAAGLNFITPSNQSSIVLAGGCRDGGSAVRIGVVGESLTTTVSCASGHYSVSLDVTSIGEGSKTFRAEQNETNGAAIVPAELALIKDTVVPTVSIATPLGSAYINLTNESAFVVSGSCSEAGGSVQITGSATMTASCDGTSWSKTFDFSLITDGTISLSVDLTDEAGNVAATASRSWTKNTVRPTVAISAPAALTLITRAGEASFAINGTCSANGQNVILSGAASATASCSGGTWSTTLDFTSAPHGSAVINVDQTSAEGNPAITVSRSFTRDIVAPPMAFTSPAAGTIGVTGLTVQGVCEDGLTISLSGADTTAPATASCTSGTFNFAVTFSAGDAAKTVTLSQTDAAGNVATISRAFERYAAPDVTFSVASQDVLIYQDTATVGIHLSAAATKTVTVPILVESATTTATSGVDYTITPPTISVPAGTTDTTFTFNVIDQETPAVSNAKVVLKLGTLTNANAGATNTQTVTIRQPAFAVNFGAMSRASSQMSVSPFNGLTYARAGTGTYVDNDGSLKTASANVPRVESDPLTGISKGLLIEPAATNVQTWVATSGVAVVAYDIGGDDVDSRDRSCGRSRVDRVLLRRFDGG